MKNSPVISVIMSEYNTNPTHLRDSIESILQQSFEDFEFIIIDDCGANNVSEIVSEFDDKRIKVFKNTRNMGFVYSLNRAIDNSTGIYIARMDTDDIALKDRLKKEYEFIIAHPEYDVVGAKAIEFSQNQEYGTIGKHGEKRTRSIMRGDTLVHPTTLFKREVIKSLGAYDDYSRAEDLGLWCKLLVNNRRLYVIDEIVLKYRVNPSDYSKRKLSNRKGEIKVRLYYYPKMKANLIDYCYIIKSILAGILPIWFVRAYRHKFVLGKDTAVKKGGRS